MSLRFRYDSKEQVPVEHMPFYAERDGAFVLQVDGVVDKSKLDEFRTSNVELIRERDELKERFKDIDPDEVRKLMAEKRRLEEEQQLKAGEFKKVLEKHERELKEQHRRELTVKSEALETATSQLTAIKIDQAVVSEATQRGLRATALQDVTARAHSVFQLVNGVPTAYEADGTTVRTGKDGITPLTLAEWVDALVSDAPHLFESNSGGGAAGNTSGGGGGKGPYAGKNPFREDTKNVTERMRLTRTDPQLAARLKAAAGGGS